MAVQPGQLRKFLMGSFNDGELEDLCVDYFPEVGENFTLGMTKGQKVRELLGYCRRRGRLDDLLGALERERPAQYKAEFAAAGAVESPAGPPQAVSERNPRQLFISHAHQDAELAQRLAADLMARGWVVWIAPDSIRPGEKWAEAIDRGLEESGAFVLLLTAAAVKSRWVKSETYTAIELEHQGEVKFLPLDVARAKAPPLWRGYQYISFRSGYEPGLKALLNHLAPEEEATAKAVASLAWEKRSPDVNEEIASEPPQEFTAKKGSGLLFVADADQLPKDPAIKRILWQKDGKEMVRVPAGDFLYGDDKKKVTLPEFWMDKTPVTNGEYALFVGAEGYEAPRHWKGNMPPEEIREHPVTYVSWFDAIAYAQWAGKELPTEEEWEKAARGADGREYPWGNQKPEKELANFNRNVGGTKPVGVYSPQGDSPYGNVDMAGNVWEWCSNKYRDPRVTGDDNTRDPRVFRGGSWFNDRNALRAASRNSYVPHSRRLLIGFRLVRRFPSQ